MFLKNFKLLGIFVLLFLAGCDLFGGAEGVVVDVNGDSIEGAIVVAGDEIVLTGEDGEFDLAADEIVVLAEGYESFEGSLDEDGEIVLEVKPYQSVFGYVYDEDGPLEEAVVVYLDPNSFEPLGFMPTDEGFVYFPGIAESNSTFLVLSGGYEVGVVSMDIDGEEDVFAVEMKKSGEVDMVSNDDGGFFGTAFAQVAQERYDKIKLYFEMAASLSQGAVLVQPFYVSSTTFNTLNHAYDTYLGQSDIDRLKREVQLLPNEADHGAYVQLWAWFDLERDADMTRSDIDIGEADVNSPIFFGSLYSTNNVTWEPIVNSIAVDTQRGMMNITADPSEYPQSLIGSVNNVSIDIDAGGLVFDNSPVSNVVISVKTVDPDNNSLDSRTHNITVDQILDSMLNSDVSGGGELDMVLTESELDVSGLKIRFELGGEIEDEVEDEMLYYLIGEPAEKGTSDPPLDPVFEDYLWCLWGVNLKYSDVVDRCMAKYGDPGANQALAHEIGKCMNEDPGYKADAMKCGE